MSDISGAAPVDDEASTADLKAKVSESWREFTRRLETALPLLPGDSLLDITLDPTASGTGDAVYNIRIYIGQGEMTALAVGNADLPAEFRLDRAAIASLVALGWSPPGVVSGSGECFGICETMAETSKVASLVSRTLRDVYGTPHPAFLTYAVETGDGREVVDAPALAPARCLSLETSSRTIEGRFVRGDSVLDTDDLVGESHDSVLADRVRTVVARLLKVQPDALIIDPDGDIGIRSGSAMVFVRVKDNPPLVDVFSPVLTDLRPTRELYAKLSELTNRMPIGRLYHLNDTVWASVPVFGRDFQTSHLRLAVQVMTGLADELDDRLAGEFGGRRFFGDQELATAEDEPAVGAGPGTGMYL